MIVDEEDEWWLDDEYDWTEELYYDTLADHFNERYQKISQMLGKYVVDCE